MAKEALIEEFKKHGLLPPDYEPPNEGEPPVGKWVIPGGKTPPNGAETSPNDAETPPIAPKRRQNAAKRRQNAPKRRRADAKRTRVTIEGDVATLVKKVAEENGLKPSVILEALVVNKIVNWGDRG